MNKQALLGAISGALAAKDNRRVGGAVAGTVAGDLVMSDVAHRLNVRGPAAAVLKGVAGGVAGYAYSKYHTKKADTKQDLIHTGTIGAVGLGGGMAAAKLADKIPSIKGKVGRTGALIGAIGLAGDYAAVKLNKHLDTKMNKTASNRYLEKAAEMYEVKGHTGVSGTWATPKVQLDRPQYHQYAKETDNSSRPFLTGLGVGAVTGAAGYQFAKSRGGKPGVAGAITGLAGYFAGKSAGKEKAHNNALERLGIIHPNLSGED